MKVYCTCCVCSYVPTWLITLRNTYCIGANFCGFLFRKFHEYTCILISQSLIHLVRHAVYLSTTPIVGTDTFM